MRVAAFIFLMTAWSIHAADVGYYGVAKGALFTQTNAGAPQLHLGYPFQFQATVAPVTNGLLGATGHVSFSSFLLGPRFAGAPFTFTDRHPTLDQLDLYYPDGTFAISMATAHEGIRSGSIVLAGDDYPNPPVITSYAQAQAINPSNDYTLRWSGFTGGTTNDFVFVQIDSGNGAVFRTSQIPGAAGALNGTNTSVVISSNILAPGRAFLGRVVFMKVASSNLTAYPGVPGVSGYFTQTDFYLATTGVGDATPPRVVSMSPAPGATNVPVNAPVILTFNEPMTASLSLFVSGSGSLAGSGLLWSPDGLTFVIQPAGKWPTNTVLGFVFNPSDGQMVMSDASRNPLEMETTLQFTTGTNSVPPATPVLADPKRIFTGRFQFKLLGESNRRYAAEASTNLVDWVPLGTNTAWGGSIQFIDTNAFSIPYRFYRGLAP
ncbi:MAG: hypothetical protein QOF48_855 [Verrucomicrobiota bacterium]|jgi:hypothetical protein